LDIFAAVVPHGHHAIVEEDEEATQLMLEAQFDIKAAVNDNSPRAPGRR